MNIFNFEYADALRGLLIAITSGVTVGAILVLVRYVMFNWLERRPSD